MNFFKKQKQRLNSLKKELRPIASSKWDAIKLLINYIYCRIRFHVNLNEYKKYEFYNLNNRYRKKFLLVYHQKKKYFNITLRYFTHSKYIIYKRIQDLFTREIILLPHCGEDCFVEFVKKHQKVILKPDKGSLGKGIEVLEYVDETLARDRFKQFSKEEPMVCEEFICQHHALMELNPFSVNTIRVVTILNEGNVEIVSAALKTGGSATKIVDNMHNGGIGMQIDIKTGITTTFGKDYKNKEYAFHPVSGAQLIGFQVPHWEKVVQLVEKAHYQLPQSLLFGWDIAITEDGAELVEVNRAPGPMLMQTMDKKPKGEKIIKMMKTIKVTQEYSKKDVYNPNYDKYL